MRRSPGSARQNSSASRRFGSSASTRAATSACRGAEPVQLAPGGQPQVPVAVPAPQPRRVARRRPASSAPYVPHRVQHPVAHPGRASPRGSSTDCASSAPSTSRTSSAGSPVAAAHVLGGLQVELPGEDRQPRPQQPLRRACTARGSSRSRSAASGAGGSASALAAGQQPEAVVEPVRAACSADRAPQPPRGQLQRERDAVEPPAQLRDVRPVVLVQREAGHTAAARSANSSTASSASAAARAGTSAPRRGPAGGAPPPAPAARAPAAAAPRPARRTRRTRCSKPSSTSSSRRPARWLDQHLALVGARCGPSAPGPRPTAWSTQVRVAHRGQLDQPARRRGSRSCHPPAPPRARRGGTCPRPPTPGHRDQPGRCQQPGEPAEFGGAPDERVEFQGQIAGRRRSSGSRAGRVRSHGTRSVLTREHSVQSLRATPAPRRPVMRYGAAASGAIGSGDDFSMFGQAVRERCDSVRWRGGRDPGGRLLGDPGVLPRRRAGEAGPDAQGDHQARGGRDRAGRPAARPTPPRPCAPRRPSSTGSTPSPRTSRRSPSNASALSSTVASTFGGPLVKVAAFGYGVRRAIGRPSSERARQGVPAYRDRGPHRPVRRGGRKRKKD